MPWWKRALFDTCSIITLDKILLDRPRLLSQFPKTILALDESFTVEQMREDTAQRMKSRVTHCPLPPLTDLAAFLTAGALSKALSDVDKLVFATAAHSSLPVVTADKRLAKAIKKKKMTVGNVAMILKELTIAGKISQRSCERILLTLAARNDFLLGKPSSTWADLADYTFPD
jgi:hypothetical protein